MNFFFLFLILPLSVAATPANYSAPYKATTNLINCGASGVSVDPDGRRWSGDVGSTFASPGLTAAVQDPGVPQTPYLSARVFTSPHTLSFPLPAAGRRHFLRLHFYPSTYSSLPPSAASFSASAGDLTLLSNFSPYQTVEALNTSPPYLILEYSLNLSNSSNLTLTFAPTNSSSYAFVNGIEIVSSPDLFADADAQPKLIGSDQAYPIGPNQAIQTVHRLNVGGQAITPSGDSGLFRSWVNDDPYIFAADYGVTYSADPNVSIGYNAHLPAYIAPSGVYSTARSMGPIVAANLNRNLTWILTVDGGFYYLVRLHFCEMAAPETEQGDRVFTVFINNQTADEYVDVIAYSGGFGRPYYADYVLITAGMGTRTDLWVTLHPNDQIAKPVYYDAVLNGMEVFKLESGGSLAGPNPKVEAQPSVGPNKVVGTPKRRSKSDAGAIAGGIVGAVVVVIAVGCLVVLLVVWKRRKGSVSGDGFDRNTSSLPSNLCRIFSFAEIEAATNGFDGTFLLGVGGFGKVYRGEIDRGSIKVAIKRANPMSDQGVHEFQTEIRMLSKLRHRHLVSLIGYCEDNGEMILVYDYMANGTLREHLYKTDNPPLSWKQRLEICVGAARGLHYLHAGAKYNTIHRDVKTTNILLDDKWVAKVSDFGLSKSVPTLHDTHVSTEVKGSYGYLDPEYFFRQQLTDKSDVYSFGVVLFEVLCARPVLNPTLQREQVSLVEWALYCKEEGTLEEIVDPYLRGKISPLSFRKFVETAEKCVADDGTKRPTMGDVVWSLEFALQLQESTKAKEDGDDDDSTSMGRSTKEDGDDDDSTSMGRSTISTTSTTTTVMSSASISTGGGSVDSEGSGGLMLSNAVFSEIGKPRGR